jgi:transcriptional regulator GlxA family with amidase domain
MPPETSMRRPVIHRFADARPGDSPYRTTIPAPAKERTRSVIEALHTLRDKFAQPLRIEELAKAAAMSPSSFHKQFRELTAMTPLQYQKHLRLLEARRLMPAEGANAETAAFRVGYESASQFSRDYSRIFGYPPKRDVTTLRAMAG